MKKRDWFWVKKILQFILIIVIFALISAFNLLKFNTSYMQEEQKELQVFKKQIEWAILPYLKSKDFKTIEKYTNDFKGEDIVIRIFDKDKKLISTSDKENYSELLDNNSKILKKRTKKLKVYKHSIKDKKIGLVDEFEVQNEKYFLEITISEVDVIKSILEIQKSLTIFFSLCVIIIIFGLTKFFNSLRSNFNSLEDSVIELANGNLETTISIPKLGLLSELTQSIKKMVSRLKNQILRLKQLEQYKSTFLENITHEIKTPITAINSAIELIEDNNSINKADRECFKIIQHQIKNITKLSDDILYLSEIEVLKTSDKKNFSEFNFNDLIKKIINDFKIFNIDINFKETKNISFFANKDLIYVMISNILTNAIRYSKSQKIDIILEKNKKDIIIEIEDFGIGIKKEHLKHIFERFYRIDKARSRKKGGTGLGLSIVKNIVELHNGEISVESQENKGTKFTIIFENIN